MDSYLAHLAACDLAYLVAFIKIKQDKQDRKWRDGKRQQ
jgi:hypothetical protein